MAAKKITFTDDNRKRFDIKITKGGLMEFSKDLTILIDNENIDKGSHKILKILTNKIKWGNPKAELSGLDKVLKKILG